MHPTPAEDQILPIGGKESLFRQLERKKRPRLNSRMHITDIGDAP